MILIADDSLAFDNRTNQSGRRIAMRWFATLCAGVLLGAVVCSAQDVGESDRALLFQYYRFNAMYFSGKLPVENVVVIWDKMISKSDIAGTWITHYDGESEKIRMGISFYAKDCETCVGMAMLHEMVHIKLRHQDIKNIHGDEFQKEMLALARQGAFASYW